MNGYRYIGTSCISKSKVAGDKSITATATGALYRGALGAGTFNRRTIYIRAPGIMLAVTDLGQTDRSGKYTALGNLTT